MKHAEYRHKVIKRQIRLMHDRDNGKAAGPPPAYTARPQHDRRGAEAAGRRCHPDPPDGRTLEGEGPDAGGAGVRPPSPHPSIEASGLHQGGLGGR